MSVFRRVFLGITLVACFSLTSGQTVDGLTASTILIAGNAPAVALTLNLAGFPAGTTFELATGRFCALGADGASTAVTPPGTQLVLPANWHVASRELEAPRSLCITPPAPAPAVRADSGFFVRTVFDCNAAVAQTCGAVRVAAVAGLLSPTQRAVFDAETVCCRGQFASSGRNIGQCYNPAFQTCCRSTPISTLAQTCCPDAANTIVPVGTGAASQCPCTRSSVATDCPTGTTCCLPSKYPQLNLQSDAGRCFNPTVSQCCNTGAIYDPGVQQCCSINGVQSLDVPCPCATDDHCGGGQTSGPNTDMACCKQVSPPLQETQQCTIFSNYPSGSGDRRLQRCLGNCINTKFQICCNGVACVARYEKCCNTTCCNKFEGTCTESFRPAARGIQANWLGYGEQFTQCTVTEAMTPLKSFWAFLIPVSLLAIMFGGLALVMVFATRITRKFSWVERCMIGSAVFSILFGFPTFFAPVWKYGVVVTLVGLFAIVTAAARLKWLNIVCVILVLIELIYIYDPWNGNAYLTLALDRNPNGEVIGDSAGILHSITRMYPNVRGDVLRLRYCSGFYNFFQSDQALRDVERRDNPLVVTFGYCSRAWTYALLMFSGVLLIFTGLLFLLSIISLVLRFKDDRGYDPIELEVRGQGSKVGSYYN